MTIIMTNNAHAHEWVSRLIDQVARSTVYEYFEVLKDTLVLHELPPLRKTKKTKPLA